MADRADRFIIAQAEAGPVDSSLWAIVDTKVRGIVGEMRGEEVAQMVADILNEQSRPQDEIMATIAASHYRDETGWPERPSAETVVWCGCWSKDPDRVPGPIHGAPYMQDGDVFIQGPMRLYHSKG